MWQASLLHDHLGVHTWSNSLSSPPSSRPISLGLGLPECSIWASRLDSSSLSSRSRMSEIIHRRVSPTRHICGQLQAQGPGFGVEG